MIALADCNACFASCEQVFRPDLRGKPLIVLSNNDGCIVARTQQAKDLGVPDLAPYFKVKPLIKCHKVHVFSANFRLYGDISHQVMAVLREFSPQVEQYSIDEMFLNMAGINDDLNDYALNMKRTLWREVRMPVSVGIAPTKTLAKLANRAAKKMKRNGVAVLDTPQKWHWLMQRLSVDAVWGVGRKLAKRLNQLGIQRVSQLATANATYLRLHMGVNIERTIAELNGEPCYGLEESPPAKKEIFVTRSFGQKTSSKEALLRHISRYAAAAAEKLRAQHGLCQSLYVFAETSRFNQRPYHKSTIRQLAYPCNDSQLIIQQAKSAMQELYKAGYEFAKCGIGLLDVRDQQFYQHDLWTPEQSHKTDQLMRVLDGINQRYGRDTLVFGAEGLTGKWTMNQHHLSPSYTSSWLDLPRVKLG